MKTNPDPGRASKRSVFEHELRIVSQSDGTGNSPKKVSSHKEVVKKEFTEIRN